MTWIVDENHFFFPRNEKFKPNSHELGWVCFYTCDGLGLEFSNPAKSS